VSENDNCLCAGTAKVAVQVTAEEESLESTSENRRRGCGMRTWHVGAECSRYGQQQQGRSDRRRSVDSRVWRTFSDSEEADWRRLRVPKSAV